MNWPPSGRSPSRTGRIAFVEGHGELDDLQVMDIVNALGEQPM